MIYMIEDTVTNMIKVGYAKGNIKQRLQNLQVGNPNKLRLRALIDGNREMERQLHTEFAEHRHSGEWFRNKGIISECLETFDGDCQRYKEEKEEQTNIEGGYSFSVDGKKSIELELVDDTYFRVKK